MLLEPILFLYSENVVTVAQGWATPGSPNELDEYGPFIFFIGHLRACRPAYFCCTTNFFFCCLSIISGENRTSGDVKIFFFALHRENRISEDVKTIFLLFSDNFRGKQDIRRREDLFFALHRYFQENTVGWHPEKFPH